MKNTPVSLVECPRDAMQGWPRMIATAQKTRYINSLLQVGFDTLDFGSFVSPKAIPQMSDTRQVLAGLDKGSSSTKLLAIVANLRGAEEAIVYDAIDQLGFPFSISPTFQQRNANSTIEEAIERVEAIQNLCVKTGKEMVVYLSMGFGNPYGDDYDADILLHWAAEMVARDIRIISLADTVGLATADQVRPALETLIPRYPAVNFGVHLHASPDQRTAKLDAAFSAGCLRFDGALKGIGGCPMAQDELVGNMDTGVMIDYFEQQGILLHLNEAALGQSMQLASEVFT